jgi:hypothetical protein
MISLDCGLTLWFQSLFHCNQIFVTEKLVFVVKFAWNFRADWAGFCCDHLLGIFEQII